MRNRDLEDCRERVLEVLTRPMRYTEILHALDIDEKDEEGRTRVRDAIKSLQKKGTIHNRLKNSFASPRYEKTT